MPEVGCESWIWVSALDRVSQQRKVCYNIAKFPAVPSRSDPPGETSARSRGPSRPQPEPPGTAARARPSRKPPGLRKKKERFGNHSRTRADPGPSRHFEGFTILVATVSVVGAFPQFDSQVFRSFRRCPAWYPALSSPPSVRIECGVPLPDSANALRRLPFFEPGFPRPGFASPRRHLWSFSASYCSHDRHAGHIVAETFALGHRLKVALAAGAYNSLEIRAWAPARNAHAIRTLMQNRNAYGESAPLILPNVVLSQWP
jgi:hypothetical protein